MEPKREPTRIEETVNFFVLILVFLLVANIFREVNALPSLLIDTLSVFVFFH